MKVVEITEIDNVFSTYKVTWVGKDKFRFHSHFVDQTWKFQIGDTINFVKK